MRFAFAWPGTRQQPDRDGAQRTAGAEKRVSEIRRFGLAAAIVFVAYTATLSVANMLALPDAMVAGAANTIPTILFGAAAYWLIVTGVAGRNRAFQFMAHLFLGACFAFFSYWLLLVMIGLIDGASVTRFEVRPFISRAMAWQTLQNVTVYGVIAVLGHQRHRWGSDAQLSARTDGEGRDTLSRYFIRNGDDAVPVDIRSIVSIAGADDYAEIRMMDGQHLARMTLAKFEKLLDPTYFVRVHRSRIINLDHVARIEPAGSGRLLVHMANGEAIGASRSGSVALKERIL